MLQSLKYKKFILLASLFSVSILNANNTKISFNKLSEKERIKSLNILRKLPKEEKIQILNKTVNFVNYYIEKNANKMRNAPFFIKEIKLTTEPIGLFLNYQVYIRNSNIIPELQKLNLNTLNQNKQLIQLYTVLGVGIEFTYYTDKGRFLFKKIVKYPYR